MPPRMRRKRGRARSEAWTPCPGPRVAVTGCLESIALSGGPGGAYARRGCALCGLRVIAHGTVLPRPDPPGAQLTDDPPLDHRLDPVGRGAEIGRAHV